MIFFCSIVYLSKIRSLNIELLQIKTFLNRQKFATFRSSMGSNRGSALEGLLGTIKYQVRCL